jgi:hypothetical protein
MTPEPALIPLQPAVARASGSLILTTAKAASHAISASAHGRATVVGQPGTLTAAEAAVLKRFAGGFTSGLAFSDAMGGVAAENLVVAFALGLLVEALHDNPAVRQARTWLLLVLKFLTGQR